MDVSQEFVFEEREESYPNHSQEETGGPEGGLSRWDTTRVLGMV